ncbi:hypothetical protein HK098_007022 [Nowakowskiella sp. JEL0407]|nr:hypothetical protein HK098_007022 [Nowakowskiella sp. JEL0407]
MSDQSVAFENRHQQHEVDSGFIPPDVTSAYDELSEIVAASQYLDGHMFDFSLN